MRRLVGAILAIALVPLAVASGSTTESGAADAAATFEMLRFGDSIVDPTSGRLFVSGDDKIEVFDELGAHQATIPALPGAAGMAIEGSSLFVVETTTDAVAEIDLTTLAVVVTHVTDDELRNDVVVIGDIAWLLADEGGTYSSLRRIDLTTGQVRSRGVNLHRENRLAEIPGDASHLLVFDTDGGNTSIQRVNLTPTPAVLDGAVQQLYAGAQDLAVTEDARLMVAGPSFKTFQEVSLTTMGPTGVQHEPPTPHGPWPNGVAYSAAREGVFVGTTGAPANTVSVFRAGTPLTTHHFVEPEAIVPAGVMLSPEADRAHVVTRMDSTHLALRTHNLLATIDGATPSVVVASVPTQVQVEGRGLAAATEVLLEGSPVPFTRVSPTQLSVEVEPFAAESPQAIRIETPFGDVSTPVTVEASTGATVAGTVTHLGEPVAGAQVWVNGRGSDAGTARTADDGTYEITGLPYARIASSIVNTPSGMQFRTPRFEVRPNETTVVDVEMTSRQGGAEVGRVDLPAGAVRDVLVAPDERVFVSVGDTIAVLDEFGQDLATIGDQWTAAGLATSGDALFVNLRDAGRINEIDLDTLEVVRSFATDRPTRGDVVVAGGRVWFSDGDTNVSGLASVDLTSLEVDVVSCFSAGVQCHNERLQAIDGDATRFLSRTSELTGYIAKVWDVGDDPPTAISRYDDLLGPAVDVASSAPEDRYWSASGAELELSTLEPTGTRYAAGTGAAAVDHAGHGPDRPGTIAIGGRVFVEGAPGLVQQLAEEPVSGGIGLESYGDVGYVATADGQVVVYALQPVITSIEPAHPAAASTVTVHGEGFGDVIDVRTISGISLEFTEVSTTKLEVELPPLPLGAHQLVVEGPLGSSLIFPFVTGPQPPPTVTGITPAVVSTAHATTAVVEGTAFMDVEEVRVGTAPVPFTWLSSTRLRITVPAHPSGPASAAVVVQTATGTSPTGGAPTVSWVVPARIDGVSPSTGTGGPVELTGSGLTWITGLSLGGTALPFLAVDDTTLHVSLPPHAPGLVTVRGTTTTDPVDFTYRYVDPPSGSDIPSVSDAATVNGSYQPLSGDFDGNGVEDIFWYAPGPAADSMWRFTADGRHTSMPQGVPGAYRPVTGDFTGDDVDDILWYSPTGADTLWDFNTGGGRTTRGVTVNGTYTPVTGDFTGDDVDDVLWYAPGSAPDSLWDFNAGGGHSWRAETVNGTYTPVAGDYTGDDVDDIAWYAPGTAADAIWDFNLGGGRTTRAMSVVGSYAPVAGDFTGDDVDDILWYAPGGGTDTLWDHAAGGTRTSLPLTITGTYRLVAADLTGGGTTDLVLHAPGAAVDKLWFMSPVVR